MSLACFKSYDIRGKLDSELTEDIAYRIGFAVAQFLQAGSLVVGGDARHSSLPLKQALASGIMDAGADVIDIGLAGTEEVYFAAFHLDVDGGIEVTASHNPIEYNGMKLVSKGAAPISGDNGLRIIEQMVINNQFQAQGKKGTLSQKRILEAYVSHLLSYINLKGLRPLKLLVDAGNGAAGHVIDEIESRFRALNIPVCFVKINHKADGDFPNGIPNPLLPENRQVTARMVKEHKADLGVAWDGDFDRCFLFDHHGEFVEGYYLVGLLAEAFLEKNPGEKIIHDPRLIWNTIDRVIQAGGQAIQCKTGHAYIKERMRFENAIYGGEMSGHHYFRDFAYCDSGMIPWLLVIELMSKTGKSLSSLVNERVKVFPCSGEINYKVRNAPQAMRVVESHFSQFNPQIDRTDGISLEFAQMRLNLRLSNTEPLLRLNVETRENPALLEQTVRTVEKLINSSEYEKMIHTSRLNSEHLGLIEQLFSLIAEDPLAKNFHPHPFNQEQARIIAEYKGQDLYLGLFENEDLIGYGMLRGWDAGYEIPSLGLYLAPVARGRGLAERLMHALHKAAFELNAPSVRLKVYPDNIPAVNLYKRMGYFFPSEENGQLVGYFDLIKTAKVE
jgi:phosphomannomutase/ribosomal protein S18 acetylase RimI-like enzyme